MCGGLIKCLVFLILFKSSHASFENDGKSSLVFVFDTTGSMYNDLKQLREGAEMILNTALIESNIIADFVFVPFHDPAVGPAVVTKDKEVFKESLEKVHVHGGGDCPEKSLTGIQLALNVSRPRSFVYVFTDATASDHRHVGKVLDLVQRKQSQVVFVLTGHCSDLDRPTYTVYPKIAAASSGQVFNLNKTSVHKVLQFVRSSIKQRNVNLGSIVNPPGYNYTHEIPVDSSLGEVTVSVSGARPQLKVVNPSGVVLTGPPQLITTLDLSEIMVVKVLQPEPGNWSITVGSEEDYSVNVVGLSNLTFNYRFSVEKPSTMHETSYRPLQGTYNHMMISLTQPDAPVQVDFAEVLDLTGRTLFEVPLKEVDNKSKIYLTDAFMPPEEFFYVAINGRDQYNQELRRIGATAVQAKSPDVPYLTAPKTLEVRPHQRVVLVCNVESLVPVTAKWTRDSLPLLPEVSSLQTTTIEYAIEDMEESHVGYYACVARNVAGLNKVDTELIMLVEPPQVSIAPMNVSLELGDGLTITCRALSEALLLTYVMEFNGRDLGIPTETLFASSVDGVYNISKSISNVNENNSGIYSCVARNRGGLTKQSTYVTVKSHPSAHISGPNEITARIHTDICVVCEVDNADTVQWLMNGTLLKQTAVGNVYSDTIELKNVTEAGELMCVAVKGAYKESDSIQIKLVIIPVARIEGPKQVTIVNGTLYTIECRVVADPPPGILWRWGTRDILDHTVTLIGPHEYRTVLTLNSSSEAVAGTYLCVGVNSEGVGEDNVTVNVRREMTLLNGFTDISVELYYQIELQCQVDSDPPPLIHWFHNGTRLTTNQNVHLAEDFMTVYFKRVGFEDLGVYMCEADNGFDKVTVNGTVSVTGLESPTILKDPTRIIALRGQPAKIICRVLTGNPEPTITWQYKTDTSSQFTSLPKDIKLIDERELTIKNVLLDHSALYRCTAENVLGRDTHDTQLLVHYPPEILSSEDPAIGSKSREVQVGEKVEFSCNAVGSPQPLVTWVKDGHPVAYTGNIHLTDSNELIIENATVHESGVYTCTAISAAGSTHKDFSLFVFMVPIISPGPAPQEVEVVEGQLVELPCSARGRPPPRTLWARGEAPVAGPGKYIDEFGLRFIANLTDFGNYTCTAVNSYGNTSTSFSVYVWVAPYIEPLEPLEVLSGSNVNIECNAVGFPLPVLGWEYQGGELTENTTDVSFNDKGHLEIINITSKHEGLYTCVAENTAGVAKQTTRLVVKEHPKIIEDNYSGPYIATNMDTAVVVVCRATGKPKPYVVWSKDGVYLDKDPWFDIGADGTLTINNPTEDMGGNYTCVAKNNVGQVNRTTVVEIYTVPTRVQADESQTTMTLVEGTNANIECPTHHSSQSYSVSWYKDAKLISDGYLTIPKVSRTHSATYACVVKNAVASIYSVVRLNVEWPPKFTDIGTGDIEVVKGDDRYLDCEVDAKPAAKTKWLLNSKPVLFEDKPRLHLMNMQLRHSGTYKCIVTNKHGTVVRGFTVDVLEPPFISEFDLLDVQLKEGTNATLECNARGSPKPYITWSFNNTNWHIQNSTLVSINVSSASEGLYRCDAGNTAGVSHIVYRVTVVVAATVTEIIVYSGGEGSTAKRSFEAVLGTHTRISCIARGEPQPTIQWIRNGKIVSENVRNIGHAELILSPVHTSQAGVYTCAASNEGGSDERIVKMEVFEPPKIFRTLFAEDPTTDNNISLEVISGQAFYLHCHPYGNPMPAVYWFKDDLPLKLFDDSMVSTDYGEVLVAKSAMDQQSGNYTCVARNSVGNTSLVYLVDVLVPPPATKESSKTVSIRFGKALNLDCPVQGTPPPYVMWIKHPYNEISEDTPRVMLLNDNYTLVINDTEVSDSGKYVCIMTNKVGNTEFTFDVTVQKRPSISGNVGGDIVEDHIVPLRRSIVLKCETDGNPPPNITWLKDTQQLSDSVSNIQSVLGNSLLAVWRMRVVDAGQYICVAESSAGAAHRRYNVAVQVPGKWTAWSKWSVCNVTCGVGYQAKARSCQYVDDSNNTIDKTTHSEKIVLDISGCKGPATEKRKCRLPACEQEDGHGQWSSWSGWGTCSVTCGAGTQARTRRCGGPARCGGDNVQIRKCPDLPKCDTSQDPSLNEVLDSSEGNNETNPYLPEATYEMHPDITNTQQPNDVEEGFYNETPPSPVYHEVNVTDNLDGSDPGPCPPGHTHQPVTDTCHDIDECVIDNNQCHSTQVCENTLGAYRCTCSPGYVSLGAGQRCLDVNECEQDIHGCEFACVNVAGGYVCACPNHLRLQPDKHHCGKPSYRRMYSEELEPEVYLSASVETPAKYIDSTLK